MSANLYTVRRLSTAAYAVLDDKQKQWAICDREKDAERVAYCLRVVTESEETAKRDERDTSWSNNSSLGRGFSR